MSKTLTLLSILLLTIFIAGSIGAQTPASEQNQQGLFKPSVKFALDTEDSFELVWWSVGADFDYHISNTLMLSPEITIQNYKFEFDWVMLYPGATINAKFGKPGAQFFIGAGSLLLIPIEPGEAESRLMFKMNAGGLIGPVKITVYLVTPFEYFFEKPVGLGMSVGYIF